MAESFNGVLSTYGREALCGFNAVSVNADPATILECGSRSYRFCMFERRTNIQKRQLRLPHSKTLPCSGVRADYVTNLYPTRCTVIRCFGSEATSSILWRRRAMWVSTVRVKAELS